MKYTYTSAKNALFYHCTKEAITDINEVSAIKKSVKKYHAVFIIFVQHISLGLQNVNKGTQHTASIRGTLRGRVKLRHIMFMTGHRKVMPENAQVIKNGIQ